MVRFLAALGVGVSAQLVGGAVASAESADSGAALVFVDRSAVGANSGVGWPNAFNDLQSALAVSNSGDRILVAKGAYRPDGGNGNRTLSFQIPSGVMVEGGYAGVSAADPFERDTTLFETTLSGDIGV